MPEMQTMVFNRILFAHSHERLCCGSIHSNRKFIENIAHNPMIKTVIWDLSGVRFIDSSGLGNIVYCQQLCSDMDINLFLYNPTATVLNMISKVKLNEYLRVIQEIPDGLLESDG